ncbi:N-acetylornithine carbamoyltransferase [Aureibacter tunicatorum]|uniref:N-succinylornithine carbamoyltransferase n=1 Tax=Aureibacter tunicatorum TaxID=866807 RepID=A0AAE3XPJ4_9BACT|nr:N-acetylornithine carbamoyltransferase [Aureibacter tunicatorum]MDR6239753.1 N-succinyl-L-ornithine transcarbamylase [Aureibacter tunicatorum]
MKNFTSVTDVEDPIALIKKAALCKKSPFENDHLGKHKTLGLIFFNPSLRTRLSTQRAAYNLGMNVIVMNIDKDSWKLEFEDGQIMNSDKAEHVKEAVAVMSQYCDLLGVRTFPGLVNRDEDYSEFILNQFIKYSSVPIISLESATLHPLQSLADMLTIDELKIVKPKIVLTWAPHIRALPQAVSNSFVEWCKASQADITVTCPEGFELSPEFMEGVKLEHNQKEAFKGADIIYAKNWSSFNDYGKIGQNLDHWIVDQEKMNLTNQAKFMHCLPVRRNLVVSDEVLDSSIVIEEANNRTYAAQAVLQEFLTSMK